MNVTTENYEGARIIRGPEPWQVMQRGADDTATVVLEGAWTCQSQAFVEVRVARECDGASAAGCDWQDAEMLDGNTWRAELNVPTGGLYRLETRLRVPDSNWRLAGDKIWHVSVGDIWVIAGQSNAVGYGHGPVLDPPSFGVSVFGANEVWRMATHPIFDSTGTKHPANRDGGWVDVSPWLAFGKAVYESTGVPVGLIPSALGGSGLGSWDPEQEGGGELYSNMLTMIAAAGGRVAGMVWYQGCSDASLENSPTYLQRFMRFVESFRSKFGDIPILTAQLNRYLDQDNPDAELPWSLVREAQRQAARQLPNLAVIPTLDLAISDAIHTSAVGNVILGQRFGQVALGMVYGKGLPWKPIDVGGARFDGDRKTIRIAFDNVEDHLLFLRLKPEDFTIVDDEGEVQVVSAKFGNGTEVAIELARDAVGKTLCHNMAGSNPPSTLRDARQWPALAFYGIEVN